MHHRLCGLSTYGFNGLGKGDEHPPTYAPGEARLAAFTSSGARHRRLLPPFQKNLKGHVRTVPGNMHVKFEVRSFNRFKLVGLTGPLRTDTHTHTYIEQKQYLRHSFRSLGEDNK